MNYITLTLKKVLHLKKLTLSSSDNKVRHLVFELSRVKKCRRKADQIPLTVEKEQTKQKEKTKKVGYARHAKQGLMMSMTR